MVYSEHDAKFYALDRQLNQEAATLDWTRSKSHVLNGVKHSEHDEEFFVDNHGSSSKKLGGTTSDQLANARATSVAAAYRRLGNASTDLLGVSEEYEEPDPDDLGFDVHQEPEPMDLGKEKMNVENPEKAQWKDENEPDPDDCPSNQSKFEPDPDDCLGYQNEFEPDPDDVEGGEAMESELYSEYSEGIIISEPDPDDSEAPLKYTVVVDSDCSLVTVSVNQQSKTVDEPDPDDSKAEQKNMAYGNISRPDEDDTPASETIENKSQLSGADKEPDPDDSQANAVMQLEPDPDDNLVIQQRIPGTQTDEPDPDDQELQRIQDPVTIICARLQKAIEMLQSEVNPSEAATVLQTLFKIIRYNLAVLSSSF
ncbi:hypothetical protein CsSME_00026933 [Camellia sinensis var. sinensis]